MQKAKLSYVGGHQVLTLPRDCEIEASKVLIHRVGDAVVLRPKAKSWDTLIGSLAKFPADFMSERNPSG